MQARAWLVLGLSVMPAASLKVTDWLTLGAGLNAMFGYMNTEIGIRTGAPGDGQLTLQDETWGFGANAGVMLEPREGTRVGATYLSPVDLDFEDRPEFSNLGPLGGAIFASPPRLDLGLTVPQTVMLSAYHELCTNWAILANVGWQNWNEFGRVDVGVDSATPTSLTTDLHYQDTWHGALGAQFRASEKWLLSAGFAYDSSPIDDEHRTLSLPVGETYRIGVGAQWALKESLHLGWELPTSFSGRVTWT